MVDLWGNVGFHVGYQNVKYDNLSRIMSSPHAHLSEFQSKHSAA